MRTSSVEGAQGVAAMTTTLADDFFDGGSCSADAAVFIAAAMSGDGDGVVQFEHHEGGWGCYCEGGEAESEEWSEFHDCSFGGRMGR